MSVSPRDAPSFTSFPAVDALGSSVAAGPSRKKAPEFTSYPFSEDAGSPGDVQSHSTASRHLSQRKRHREASTPASHLVRGVTSGQRSKDLPKDKAQDGAQSPQVLGELRAKSMVYHDPYGDRDNVTYERVASATAPKYRRTNRGRILGLGEEYRAVTTADKAAIGIEVAESGLPYIPRYSSASNRRLYETHLRIKAIDSPPDHHASFWSLEPDGVEGPDDGGGEVSPEIDVVDEARSRVNHHEKLLARSPGNVDGWLAYAYAHRTNQADRAEMEVTLAILQRGLEDCDGVQSTPLHLDILRTIESLWPEPLIEKRWHWTLDLMTEWLRNEGVKGEDVCRVWREYLSWVECLPADSTRRVEDVIVAYQDVMARLQTIDYRGTDAREEHLCYAFGRLCQFVRRAGYEERATAMVQAICEFTFFRPESLPGSDADSNRIALDALEDFWESGYPLCGEPGAKGWKYARPAARSSAIADTSRRQEPGADDFYVSWAATEGSPDIPNTRPVRVHDIDHDDEDPYRCVLFEDVRQSIFPIHTDAGRTCLVHTMLGSLGLSMGSFDHSTARPASTAMIPQSTRGYLKPVSDSGSVQARWQIVEGQPMDPVQSKAAILLADQPVRCWVADLDTLLGKDAWFRDLGDVGELMVDRDMIRNILTLVCWQYKEPVVDMYHLGFEAACSLKQALKINKTLLAQDQSNIRLWIAHARLERRRDRIDSARAIYATTLGSALAMSHNDSHLQLWSDWASMEWERRQHDNCREIVLAHANGRVPGNLRDTTRPRAAPSAVDLLRAQQYFDRQTYPLRHDLLVLTCLYYYQDGLASVQRVCQRQLEACGSESAACERAHQLLNKIIYYHNQWFSPPAKVLRTASRAAAAQYPSNTQFHTLFLVNELRAGLESRIHDHATKLLNAESQSAELLWAIWAIATISSDIHNPASGGYSRVRSAFDRALRSRVGKRTALIWILAVDFEASSGQSQIAKELSYRAIATLGGNKDLYLLPFKPHVRPAFTDAELRQLVDRLISRGLRLRNSTTVFSRTVEESEDAEVALPKDDDLAEDELQFLREAQALRPY